ncbi:MAG: hypothetical protein NTW28_01445 [Candidatus Solibacter sp.]|nr:hypothetical protein [Candidatus Solibacter sp.]
MHAPQIPIDPGVDLGRLLGQRRAFGAVSGRCSAAHAQLLRRIRDEKLYRALTPSWRTFCGTHLAITCRHADRLIALLNRFGPTYFEISQLVGISPRQYLAIEPVLREHSALVSGEVVSLIPENAPKVLEAVGQLLREARRPKRARRPPQTLADRVADLTRRGRDIANQLISLYNSSRSQRDRELILEAATVLRVILMQPGLD